MRLSFDPKPIGAFIEYTLKPLIDYSHELLDVLDKHGLKANDIAKTAVRIYVIDLIVRSLTNMLTTGLICYTAWLCLHTRA